MKPRESDSECAEDARSDDRCCTAVCTSDNCIHWKGQDEVG